MKKSESIAIIILLIIVALVIYPLLDFQPNDPLCDNIPVKPCDEAVWDSYPACHWDTTDCFTCGNIPVKPCDNAVWNEYPTCSWDESNCLSDCGIIPESPCFGAEWIGYPYCEWNDAGCEAIGDKVLIGEGDCWTTYTMMCWINGRGDTTSYPNGCHFTEYGPNGEIGRDIDMPAGQETYCNYYKFGGNYKMWALDYDYSSGWCGNGICEEYETTQSTNRCAKDGCVV